MMIDSSIAIFIIIIIDDEYDDYDERDVRRSKMRVETKSLSIT